MVNKGLPTAGLVTSAFSDFARQLLEQRQAAVTPLVEVGHPVGGIAPDAAADLITDDVVSSVVAALTNPDAAGSDAAPSTEETS